MCAEFKNRGIKVQKSTVSKLSSPNWSKFKSCPFKLKTCPSRSKSALSSKIDVSRSKNQPSPNYRLQIGQNLNVLHFGVHGVQWGTWDKNEVKMGYKTKENRIQIHQIRQLQNERQWKTIEITQLIIIIAILLQNN